MRRREEGEEKSLEEVDDEAEGGVVGEPTEGREGALWSPCSTEAVTTKNKQQGASLC